MYIAGFAQLGPGVGVVDGDHHDLALAVAHAERRVLQELRPRLLEALKVGLELGVVVPAIEVEPDLELRVGPEAAAGPCGRGRAAGAARAPRNAGAIESAAARATRTVTCFLITIAVEPREP